MARHNFVWLILWLIVACATTTTSAFKITDCAADKNPAATLKSVEISTCPNASGERCDLIKGSNATLVLDFTPLKVFSQANIAIKAKIGPIYLPFQLSGPTNACGNYGLTCPVKVGDTDEIRLSLPVLRLYPSIKTIVHFEVNDETNKPIVCFEFPVQLKDRPSHLL